MFVLWGIWQGHVSSGRPVQTWLFVPLYLFSQHQLGFSSVKSLWESLLLPMDLFSFNDHSSALWSQFNRPSFIWGRFVFLVIEFASDFHFIMQCLKTTSRALMFSRCSFVASLRWGEGKRSPPLRQFSGKQLPLSVNLRTHWKKKNGKV